MVNYFKNFRSPDAVNIPVILPNREKPLFDLVENFRFRDGGQFDPRYSHERIGLNDYWALSNERANVGFMPTFETNKTYFDIGTFKLDWFFIKPASTRPGQISHYGPAGAVVARQLNKSIYVTNASGHKERVSDHNPSVVYINTK